MTTNAGILGWGTYLPRFRMRRETIAAQVAWLDKSLSSVRGRRTVGNWDEDALTMAVAAARAALDATGRALPDLRCSSLIFASTTAPFADRSNCGLIAEALGWPGDIACHDTGGSQRAASAALLSVLQNPATDPALIVAADRRGARPGSGAEMRYGDAAAAVVVGPGAGVAKFLGGLRVNQDFVHQYRSRERDTDYVFEDRWVRDEGVLKVMPQAIADLAKTTGIDLAGIDHLVLAVPQHHGRKVCGALGVPADKLGDDLAAAIGQSGVGQVLLQLAHALENAQPGQRICVAGFGQGCDVALFETTDALAAYRPAAPLAESMSSGVDLEEYLKLPVFGRQLKPDRGIRGEADKRTVMAAHHRRHRDINSMLGSRCEACGTPHFPRARVCVSCRAVDRMEDYGFARRRAWLKTFTEDWLAATPGPPLTYGNVAFEGGGNAFLELTDAAPGSLEIGMPLEMHFRVKDYDDARGFRRYFWKPAPPRTPGASEDDNA